MQINTLQALLDLLLPWLLGCFVAGGIAMALLGRQARRKTHRKSHSKSHRNPSQQPAREAAQAPTGQRPPAPPAQPVPPAQPAPPAPAHRPLRADLLLVDDSAVVRAKLRRLFEPAGYGLDLARDGEEALALLHAGRYALMLTDLEMPRLDGVGLIAAVQQQPAWSGMPILAITGHDDLQTRLQQLQAVTGIYRKPWVDADLLRHVQGLVQPSRVPTTQAQD